MPASVRPEESPREALPRVVREQLDKARTDLAEAADPAESVHSARKRLKRLRALLRLAREGMDPETFGREKERLRDAARPLGESRDATVLVATLDALGTDDAVAAARGPFADRQAEATRRAIHDDAALDRLSGSLGEASEALGADAFAGLDRAVLRAGLRRIARRGRKARRVARHDPTSENLHEWRKRVKDLAYALDAFRPVLPRALGRRADLADALAEALGDDHDLAVLREALLSGEGPAESVDALLPRIDARRAELQEDAFRLGRKLHRDRPRDLADRVDRAWRSARSGATAR